MNIGKFFPFVADNPFRDRRIACVSSLNGELNFCSDADFRRFPVVAAAPPPILLSKPCIYVCFDSLYLFCSTFKNLFW